MKVSEILRKIADVVDQDEATAEPAVQPATSEVPSPQAEPVAATITVTSTGGEIPDLGAEVECCNDKEEPAVTMVSPLQQEHELLKKSQGVNNNVSEFAGDEDGYQDELAAMKQSAGIGEEQANTAAHKEAQRMEDQLNPRRNAAIAMQKTRSDRA